MNNRNKQTKQKQTQNHVNFNKVIILLGAHAKIWNPTTTPSGVLNNGIKKSTTRKED